MTAVGDLDHQARHTISGSSFCSLSRYSGGGRGWESSANRDQSCETPSPALPRVTADYRGREQKALAGSDTTLSSDGQRTYRHKRILPVLVRDLRDDRIAAHRDGRELLELHIRVARLARLDMGF